MDIIEQLFRDRHIKIEQLKKYIDTVIKPEEFWIIVSCHDFDQKEVIKDRIRDELAKGNPPRGICFFDCLNIIEKIYYCNKLIHEEMQLLITENRDEETVHSGRNTPDLSDLNIDNLFKVRSKWEYNPIRQRIKLRLPGHFRTGLNDQFFT